MSIGIPAYSYAINVLSKASALVSPRKPEKPSNPFQVPRGFAPREPLTVEPITIFVEKGDICAGFDIPENPSVDDFIKEFDVLEKITEEDEKDLNRVDCYYERSVDPNFTDSQGDSPIMLAVSNWMLPVIKRMHKISKIDFSRRNKNGLTAMHLSVATVPKDQKETERMKEVITYLISVDGKVDALSENGFTPLMVAVKADNIEAARFLLENFSATPDAPNAPFKFNPLILAITSKNIKSLELLLNHHADVLAVNDNDDSAFHLAAANGFLAGLQMMLTTVPGLEVNSVNSNGETALHYAVYNDQAKVVEYLLYQAKGNKEIKNKSGLTAYHCAHDKKEILEYFVYFEERKANYDKQLSDEIADRSAKSI